jgi:hypothetical protein
MTREKLHLRYEEPPSEHLYLTHKPQLVGQDNDADWISGPYDYLHRKITREFSEANRNILIAAMTCLPYPINIVEIGVNRNGALSSTTSILENKKPDDRYFGIDLSGPQLYGVTGDNVFTFCGDSGAYEAVLSDMEAHDMRSIDLLVIDGWHSVNQVLKDWNYSDLFNTGSIVLMHDTNYHPGPSLVFDAIDEKKFKKHKFMAGSVEDWGIGMAVAL